MRIITLEEIRAVIDKQSIIQAVRAGLMTATILLLVSY